MAENPVSLPPGGRGPAEKPHNAADARQKAADEARHALLIERTRRDWEGVLGSESGRRTLANILSVCGIDGDLHPSRYKDDREHMAAIGARTVGLWIRQEIRSVDPGLIERMLYEFSLPPEGAFSREVEG